MSDYVAMCTYHDITMHYDIAMSRFYYVLLYAVILVNYLKLYLVQASVQRNIQ